MPGCRRRHRDRCWRGTLVGGVKKGSGGYGGFSGSGVGVQAGGRVGVQRRHVGDCSDGSSRRGGVDGGSERSVMVVVR